MARPKQEEEILRDLGYDPDDESYSVQIIQDENAGIPVTATETDELKAAVHEAIAALQRALKLLK
jgi:hypothetical protein